MPVKIPHNLPARKMLEEEKVFVMTETRALHQDIRPLQIAILNLMPTKIDTETQILRLLGNSPLQVEISLVHMETHSSRNTAPEHLDTFYSTFDDIRSRKFDGLIITGAPVEHLDFHEVDYWKELEEIFHWSKTNVYSTLHVCWGAQAGLYYHYKVPKYPLPEKQFGVFSHHVLDTKEPIVRGFDDRFFAPHSRHTETRKSDIEKVPELKLIAESSEAGVFLVVSEDKRRVFATGHLEYDTVTLKKEFDRDVAKSLPIKEPVNYFLPETQTPFNTWRSHANLLFVNWLNYYVYQLTPYDLNEIPATGPSDWADYSI